MGVRCRQPSITRRQPCHNDAEYVHEAACKALLLLLLLLLSALVLAGADVGAAASRLLVLPHNGSRNPPIPPFLPSFKPASLSLASSPWHNNNNTLCCLSVTAYLTPSPLTPPFPAHTSRVPLSFSFIITLYRVLPLTAGFFDAFEARGAKVPAVWRVSLLSCLSRLRVLSADLVIGGDDWVD